MDDPFVLDYDEPELKIAAEFLTNWLPFLTRDLCTHCSDALAARIRSLHPGGGDAEQSGDEEAADSDPGNATPEGKEPSCDDVEESGEEEAAAAASDPVDAPLLESAEGTKESPSEAPPLSPRPKMSWADMAQEDELEEDGEEAKEDQVEGREELRLDWKDDKGKGKKTELSRERREQMRLMHVTRKKDFMCYERVKGKLTNILQGLELHTGVFSTPEQNRIVDFVYELQKKGRNGELGKHTYSEPQKWMRGKGRVTIQFGCCYNYAPDKEGNPAGILKTAFADPLPPLFKRIIKRLVQWHVLPPTCVPDSCIVNIYEPGDCIPPHIDSHDFVRPFCTISFLSECNIVFGSSLKIIGPGEFIGAIGIPLPLGSVLVLNGNGADVAKHCVPAVLTKRISITFRKMDTNKYPLSFKPEPDLQDIQPLPYGSSEAAKMIHQSTTNRKNLVEGRILDRVKEYVGTQPVSRTGPDSQDNFMHDYEIGKSGKKSSHGGVHHRPVGESNDLVGVEGSAGRPTRHGPLSDLPGILPLPRQGDVDLPSRRSQSAHDSLKVRSDFVTRQHVYDSSWNGQAEPVMRIICRDDRRIVVRSNFDTEEQPLSTRSPGAEARDMTSERGRPINHRRRRVRVSSPRT